MKRPRERHGHPRAGRSTSGRNHDTGINPVKMQIRTSTSDQFSLLNSQLTVQALK